MNLWYGMKTNSGVVHHGKLPDGANFMYILGKTPNLKIAKKIAHQLNMKIKKHEIDDEDFGHGFYSPITFPSINNLKDAEQSVDDTLTGTYHSIFK